MPEVEVADVLDEVDKPDAAELMQLDHAIAVHFKLGTRPDEEGTLPLRFEDMSEQLESSICERGYPVYNEVRTKPDSTVKKLTEALKHEKNPIGDTSRNGNLCTFAESRCNVLNCLAEQRQRIAPCPRTANSLLRSC
jgi:hypothetical protein